ncbi:MAG TPA: SDR family NAD(P)-dependent oxidoreductase [Nocardioidaceae bacterium]|nr:SDR family NAD(P)-dependent oxidoreductase [Nocardioidaceae bacterium]
MTSGPAGQPSPGHQPPPEPPTQPRTVLVVGASSGIGRAAAHQLAEQGARLVLAARAPESLEQARQECVGRGAEDVLVVPTDIGDRDAVDALFRAAVERFGRVDGVVHAAAVLAYGVFEEVPADVFDRILTTNVTGTANIARSALLLFGEQDGGSLVVVGSVLGKIATPLMASYCTSKWAIHGLVRTLQIEARGKPGVHVSLVSPGGVDTPIYDLAGSYTGRPGNPPPPVVSPEKVARAVVAALDKPGRDIAVGPANLLMVAGFRLVPGVFDVLVGPMMRLLGQGRGHLEDNPGNVFEPRAGTEAVHGRWPHFWG